LLQLGNCYQKCQAGCDQEIFCGGNGYSYCNCQCIGYCQCYGKCKQNTTPVKTTAAPTTYNQVEHLPGHQLNVNYGNVQVKITVVNGRITDAVAVKAPSGKNDRYTNMAVPILKKQTLKPRKVQIFKVHQVRHTQVMAGTHRCRERSHQAGL
jgi:uncharacterized protein with FMN-binding domain